MTRGAEARLFVALELPREVRAQLAGWARSAAASLRAAAPASSPHPVFASRGRYPSRRRDSRPLPTRQLRLLEVDTLHVTLSFLGNRPMGEIDTISQAIAAVCAEAAPVGGLSFGAPLWLPPRHPRALAVELHDTPQRALDELHNSIRVALAQVCGIDPPPPRRGADGLYRRRFRPHVTVARMRPSDAPHRRELPATPALSFVPSTVTLQRSWLTPTEAVYETIASCPVPAPR